MSRWFGGSDSRHSRSGAAANVASGDNDAELALIAELQNALRSADAATRQEAAAAAAARAEADALSADVRASQQYQAQAQQRCMDLEKQLQAMRAAMPGTDTKAAVDRALMNVQDQHQDVMAKVLTAKKVLQEKVEALESRLQQHRTSDGRRLDETAAATAAEDSP